MGSDENTGSPVDIKRGGGADGRFVSSLAANATATCPPSSLLEIIIPWPKLTGNLTVAPAREIR